MIKLIKERKKKESTVQKRNQDGNMPEVNLFLIKQTYLNILSSLNLQTQVHFCESAYSFLKRLQFSFCKTLVDCLKVSWPELTFGQDKDRCL